MNRALTSCASAALLFAASLSASALAATYHVHATAGSDNSSTNNGSSSKPWKTFAKANSVAIAGDTVLLSGGTTWQETLHVKSNVTYNTYGSTAPAIISGGRSVSGLSWSLYKPKVYVATTNASVESGTISQVWVGNTRLTRARTPNVGSGSYAVTGSRYFKAHQQGNDTTLHVAPADVSAIDGNDITGASVFARNVGSDLNEYTVASITGGGGGQPVTLGLSHVNELEPNDFDIPRNRYPIYSQSGYWLENKLWMLDKEGEWYFDAIAHRLYIWMPGGIVPGSTVTVSSQPHGIVADGATNFKITNIQVQNTASDGIKINHTSGAILSNLQVLKSGRRGISMAGSSGNTIQNSTVDASTKEGIWLGFIPTSNPVVSPFSMRSLNTAISGTKVLNSGLGGYAFAAVLLGEGGSFRSGQVVNSPYLGIFATLGNTVELNLVQNVCTDFDDCGGIYVGQPPIDKTKDDAITDRTQPRTKALFPNNVVIHRNKVDTGKGSIDGVPPANGAGAGTDTRGIYLDDFVNATTVTKNYVTGMRYGIMLHTAFNNTLSGNWLIGNRSHNLLMQEDWVPSLDGATYLRGGMWGNTIQANGMVAGKDAGNASLAIPNIQLIAQGGTGPTGNFASFDLNRYVSLNQNATAVFAYNYGSDVTQAGVSQDMTFANWQQLFGKDLQGSFKPYQPGREAWGFSQHGSASSGLNVECIAASATPCGPFVSIFSTTPTNPASQLTMPFSLNAGSSLIMIN